MGTEFLTSLLGIVMVNIVLSGDNAVVIAMAARCLPEDQQKKAILWGSGAAIGLRIVLTVLAVYLLKIPFIQFAGGILLILIAFKLIQPHKEEEHVGGASSLMEAVKTILVADLVMSLDNVLALAAIANGNYTLLIIGLIISIPLIVGGSKILMKVMDRFPVVTYIGAGLIAYTAGEMMVRDEIIGTAIVAHVPHYMLPAIITVSVVGYATFEKIVTAKKSRLLNNSCLADRIQNGLD